MITALRKPDLPARFDNTPILLECEDWDSLYASVHRLVEENRELHERLRFYRQRYGHLVTKRQLAKDFREK